MIEIKQKTTGVVLLTIDADTLTAANLTGANLHGANLTAANLRWTNLRWADLTGAKVGNDIPTVPNIDAAILSAVTAKGQSLQMDDWHTCETTHCRAGWAIVLAGEPGRELEKKIGSANAGTLIYLASRPGKNAPDFYASNEAAMADLIDCAAETESPQCWWW